ncbi:SGNH/GDSL hydrolase family protein [Bacteroides sp. 519]|uniref:SGNH/GDSL hydrolase family protein n=1 Tax=Bacteroides sp. 519 TaxID=2302937 RepID=UPI0013D461E4|nr:SGNH/GDSL hydrolase family protein [Bacteroides sp. 519]NDV60064.1 hypothetical protein [Bacteroides sp. 519]
MKNYLKYSLYFTWSVLIILLLLHELPALTIGGYTFRKVDLLSDIKETTNAEEADSVVVLPPIAKPAFVDTCRAGITCIVDYSDSTWRGMKPFYEALNQIEDSARLVKVAVFGDSFIEADILTADLREMLQQQFGGCGVGYVDVTSSVYGFRPTVIHSFKGWRGHAATDSMYFERSKQGISCRYSEPSDGAYVEYKGQSKYASLLDTFDIATVYFHNKGNLRLSARINKEPDSTRVFAAAEGLQEMQLQGKIGSVRWRVNKTESAMFYGATLDGASGIAVDNFSLRSSNGTSLKNIPAQTLKEFNRVRPYDLIILQYGLNIATQSGKNYDYYQKGILATIDHLKECFPQAGILLLSVGDRDYRASGGEMRTMPGIKNLISYQEHIAAESRIAFWNMFEAMGGDGSIAEFVRSKPSKANLDYTHINFRGGKELAGLLYESLIYGKEQYDKRCAYEKE